jgi:hypothetical protein
MEPTNKAAVPNLGKCPFSFFRRFLNFRKVNVCDHIYHNFASCTTTSVRKNFRPVIERGFSVPRQDYGAFLVPSHRPLTKGRITQQSSPEHDESNAFSKNVFLASTEDNNLGTEFELIWSNG